MLNEIAADKPRAYSFLLQTGLSMLGVSWPKGVFRYDYSIPERGRRQTTDLGVRALALRAQRRLSDQAIAKTLLPEQYQRNRKEAIECVRAALFSAEVLQPAYNRLRGFPIEFFLAPGEERHDFLCALIARTWDEENRQTPPEILRDIAMDIRRFPCTRPRMEERPTGEQGCRGQHMDVTSIIAELRSEREQIEQDILSLERFGRRSAGATRAKPRSVTEMKRRLELDDGSLEASADMKWLRSR